MNLKMSEIKRLYSLKTLSLRYTIHLVQSLAKHNISLADLEYALQNGMIIEQCPDDYPTPSCFIVGLDLNKRFLTIVCAVFEEELWLVTAYYPIMDLSPDIYTKSRGEGL